MAKINRLVAKVFWLAVLIVGLLYKPASAADLQLIYDAETQNYLAQIIRPLFKAGGVAFDENRIFIVNDNSLNAFVSDGNYVFVHTGTLMAADNTNELSGILAHETGHIMGGHIVRHKLKLEKMQYVMLGSMLLAGATAVSTGRGDAAMAILLGSQSSAISHLMNYQVQEERSADESAVKLLTKTGQSTSGLLNFMNKIKTRNSLSGIDENLYFRTHPLTSERISHFMEVSKNNHYPANHRLDAALTLIKAKLAAFLADKQKAERLYPQNQKSAANRYANSILAFRSGNITKALQLIDSLLKEQPNNPYFYELKAQFLFESGKVKESIEPYEKALKITSNPLLEVSLAQAILETNPQKAQLQKSITLLQRALVKTELPIAWQLLSRAYELNGEKAASYYAAAEFNYAIDNPEMAKKHLERAEKLSPDKRLALKLSDLKQKIKTDMEAQGKTF